MTRQFRRTITTLVVVVLCAGTGGSQSTPISPDVAASLSHVSADSLREHLKYISSDALEGRNTPSRGLDMAADYIASQFRYAGLEPIGPPGPSVNDGYFQIANYLVSERDMSRFKFQLTFGNQAVNLNATQVSMTFTSGLNLSAKQIFKIDSPDSTEQITGKIVIAESTNTALNRIAALNPSALILVNRTNPTGSGGGPSRLVDLESRANTTPATAATAPRITLHGTNAIRLYDALVAGANTVTLTMNVPAFEERPVQLRNVIGILRGSDPALRDTYVMLTAHYDHLGTTVPAGPDDGTGIDRIYNGANDDGSGTVSVIEIASALAKMNVRPKRSIVFMTVFGEEKGLLGSRYYGRHPVFPISKTVADVNLEQVGRTDSTEGPQIDNASMTGFDFSDVGTIFQKAGMLTGIDVYKHARNSDPYFSRSDNQALADQGVPAHTLCVAFDYPDYHKVTDHYEKVDYPNMAKVDRMVALGLVMIANSAEEPKWNAANPQTSRYIDAWKKQHP